MKKSLSLIIPILSILSLSFVFIYYLKVDRVTSILVVFSLAVGYILFSLVKDSKRLSLSMQSLTVETHLKQPVIPVRNLYSIESYKHKINNLNRIIGSYDSYTMEHNQEVAKLTLLLSEKLEIDDNTAQIIYYAGLIHDIGKIHIKDE